MSSRCVILERALADDVMLVLPVTGCTTTRLGSFMLLKDVKLVLRSTGCSTIGEETLRFKPRNSAGVLDKWIVLLSDCFFESITEKALTFRECTGSRR